MDSEGRLWLISPYNIPEEKRDPDYYDIPSFLELFVALYQELAEGKGIRKDLERA